MFQLDSASTIVELKERVSELFGGSPVSAQKLMFNGRPLSGNEIVPRYYDAYAYVMCVVLLQSNGFSSCQEANNFRVVQLISIDNQIVSLRKGQHRLISP
jgi:hypothetical protein